MRYYLSLLLLLFTLCVNADVHQMWDTMPDSLLIHKAQAKVLLENELYLKASVSSTLEVEMRQFTCEDGKTYLCYVRTYSAPEKESVVEIFDANWNKYKTVTFSLADIVGKEKLSELKRYFEPLLISVSLNDNTDEMILKVSTKGLSDDEKKELSDVNLQTNVKLGADLLK